MTIPQVSVLMCASNASKFIGEAIESILGQTMEDFEFIIVENGSSDDTLERIHTYNDARIRVFSTPIQQLPFNLNFGLLYCRAELVARMDADDVAAPERLQAQLDFMNHHKEVQVLGTSYVEFTPSGLERVRLMPTSNEEIRAKIVWRTTIGHPTVMVRRLCLLAARGYEHVRFCEDLDLWLRLMRKQEIKFANLAQPLLRYRVHIGQSRGKKEAYYSAASIFLKESLVDSKGIYFLSCLVYAAKGLLFGRR